MSDRELAELLVRLAGEIALDLRGGAVESKGGATDVVTAADRQAEAAMVVLLRKERPDDAVLGEEGADVAGDRRRWLLDPVDGTLNYARGLPAWCAAACLMEGDWPLASAVFDPVSGELFSAARKQGATADGVALGGVGATALEDAVVATFVDERRRDGAIARGTERLLRRVGALRAVGCGTLELAWVAAGRLDGWVQADVEPWDWHPGALLVAESGGAVLVSGRWRVAARGERLARELLGCVEG